MKRKHELTFYQKEKKIKPYHFKGAFVLIFWMLALSFVAFVLVLLFGMKTSVVGEGMEPSLYNSQEVLIDRTAYLVFNPKVGDIIAFYPNGNENSHYYVKRVVGLPGDTLYIEGGHLYVNGYIFKDEGLYDFMDYSGLLENELTLKEDEYFVLGDNRNESEDSRYGDIGPVKKSLIEGRVWFRFKCNDQKMGFVKR